MITVRKQQKVFIIIGIPTLIFFIFLISQSYLILGTFLTVFLIVFIVGFCLHRKNLALNLTKLGILTFLLFFLMFPNPMDWGNQLYRRMDRRTLLTPNDPKIAMLNNSFYIWYAEKNDTYFGTPVATEFKDLDEVTQVKLVQFFIYNRSNPNRIMNYSYDFLTPPRYAYDHLATVNEILNDDATFGTDDCDGIAVVTCSLLIYMGYDAYIAEGDFHWWTVVFINGTRNWDEGNPVMLNWWPEVGKPYYLFNEKYIIITQPIPTSVINILSETGGYVYGVFYYDFLMGAYINPILAWLILICAFLLICLLIQYFLIVPYRWKLKKKDIGTILFAWIYMIVIGLLLFALVHFGLEIFGHALVFTSLAILIFLMDRNVAQKIPLFKKIQ